LEAQLSTTKAEDATIKMSMGEYMTLCDAYTRLVWDKWLRSQGISDQLVYNDHDETSVYGRRLTIDMESHVEDPLDSPTVYEFVKCPGCGFRTLVDFSGFGNKPNEPTNCAFCLDPELREGV
jgi:hypothetical protein